MACGFRSSARTGIPAAASGSTIRASRRCASRPHQIRRAAIATVVSTNNSASRLSHQNRRGTGTIGSGSLRAKPSAAMLDVIVAVIICPKDGVTRLRLHR
jgi:hypothetical protein